MRESRDRSKERLLVEVQGNEPRGNRRMTSRAGRLAAVVEGVVEMCLRLGVIQVALNPLSRGCDGTQ